MTTKRTFRAFIGMGALATAAASWGCVADRPSRNGVFNENQYIRKDFIIQPGDGTGADTGWMMKTTITAASQPNPLAALNFFVGAEGSDFVRFVVTQDHLNLVSMREIDDNSNASQGARVPQVANSWPVTNVDLKYQINLDGEKTNFYQENQELDWQTRQWVKLNFAKNDLSDVASLGPAAQYWLGECADVANSSASLVDGSFQVDETNNYMQWTVQVTVPMLAAPSDACNQAMQSSSSVVNEFYQMGRSNVTFNLAYSFMRAVPQQSITYQSLVLDEKDPIQHKYGVFKQPTMVRDNNTGLLASRQVVIRFDPTKPIVWYFAAGYPDDYKQVFVKPGGVQDQTNQVLASAGAAARVQFLNNDDLSSFGDHAGPVRQYGDIRYSFIRFESDSDTGSPFLGVTQFVFDPRTGQNLSGSINLAGYNFKASTVQRIDWYLQTLGAAAASKSGDGSVGVNANGDWADGPAGCQDGQVMPIVPTVETAIHDESSTLFYELQKALNQPAELVGAKAPQDFIAPQDDDFRRAYFALIPYIVYNDPTTNAYVIPEGQGGVFGPVAQGQMWATEKQFQALNAKIDQGIAPFEGVTGPTGLQNATTFVNSMRDLSINHDNLTYAQNVSHPDRFYDAPGMITMQAIEAKDARHCIMGHWETKDEWVQNVVDSYWAQVVTHEFGHALGLEHNFMGSVDAANYPHYKDRANPPQDHIGMYTSSVMDYNNEPDRVYWYTGNDPQGNPIQGWGPYDKGAIAFIYANTVSNAVPAGSPVPNISGQVSATAPWNDPMGFTPTGQEIQFLDCTDYDLKYTPLCRQFDTGSTPSEIIANEIDLYETNYKYRNFRQYFKFWNDQNYASGPAGIVTEMRKFISMWAFDWGSSELTDTFRRIGITNPDPNGTAVSYYSQLTNKFTNEMSAANSMVAAFHNAVIQQSAGQRPFKTVYDSFYGDVTQQGIILDKYYAMQGWVGLWPTNNYDQNQAGSYIASYAGLGEPFYDDVSQVVVTNMVGGAYDTYPWFVPSAVALYAQDTHSPSFGGDVNVRDWIGGHVFTRLQDFLDYFRQIAVQNNLAPWQTSDTIDTVAAAPAGGASVVTLNIPNTSGLGVGDTVTVGDGNTAEQTTVIAVSQQSVTVTLTLAHTAPFPVRGPACTAVATCKYDPTAVANFGGQLPGEFIGPDSREWIYSYVPDRNTWIAAQRERNTATYLILHTYNLDIQTSNDDGAFPGAAYGDELPIKYTLDAFVQYN